jgi:hypothetical protein
LALAAPLPKPGVLFGTAAIKSAPAVTKVAEASQC